MQGVYLAIMLVSSTREVWRRHRGKGYSVLLGTPGTVCIMLLRLILQTLLLLLVNQCFREVVTCPPSGRVRIC